MSMSNLPLLGNTLQASGDLVQRAPHYLQKVKPRGNTTYKEQRLAAFAVLNTDARVPEKLTAHPTNSSPE